MGEGDGLLVWPPQLLGSGDVDGRGEGRGHGDRDRDRDVAWSEGSGGARPGEAGALRKVRPARIGRGEPAVELGGPTRIIVPLTGADVDELRAQCQALGGHPVDLVEWRVDQLAALRGGLGVVGGGACGFGEAGGDGGSARPVRAGESRDTVEPVARRSRPGCVLGRTARHAVEEALEVVLGQAGLPVIATVRTVHEGGAADLGDLGYAELVEWLASGGAHAVDVEYRRAGAASIIENAHRAGTAVIASNHDFGGTPPEDEVIARLVAMRDLGADVAKVSYRAREPLDMFPVLNAQMWAREHLGIPVIAISMGMAGAITRIGGERLGSAATFATVGRGSAPGQFSAEAVAEALREIHPA